MRLPKRIAFFIALAALCCLASLPGAAPAQAAEEVHIHYLVVPASSQDANLYDTLEKFRIAVAELAGGYTELGPSQGGSLHDGELVREMNYSFMISASTDLSGQLTDLIKLLFNEQYPFILHWTGQRHMGD